MHESRHPCKRRVVAVGVDGSAGAREALRWAAAEARPRRVPLRVVHASTSGLFGAGGAGYGYPYIGGSTETLPRAGFSDVHRAAEQLLEELIGDLGADFDGLEIERRIVEGEPAEVLVGAVSERDLPVVGSRGHAGFAGLMLGSVSRRCAHHAPCPVVIVRSKQSPASGPESTAAAWAQSAALADSPPTSD
jgi:nucleotide-binding universal stress UspA family protein